MKLLEKLETTYKLSEAPTDVIKEVQQCLKIKVDGICGVETLLNFYKFKRKYNLAEPDFLGATTAKCLIDNLKFLITENQAETIFGRQITTSQLNDLNNCLSKFAINSPNRTRHFMSQVAHESGGLKWLEELATGEAYEFRRDLGNNQPGDGRQFKGGGVLQLTGRKNYQALCNYLNDPRVMEGCKYVAEVLPFTSAGYWWYSNKMNSLCDLGATVEQITRRVNGGINGLSDRKRYYAIALEVIR